MSPEATTIGPPLTSEGKKVQAGPRPTCQVAPGPSLTSTGKTSSQAPDLPEHQHTASATYAQLLIRIFLTPTHELGTLQNLLNYIYIKFSGDLIQAKRALIDNQTAQTKLIMIKPPLIKPPITCKNYI